MPKRIKCPYCPRADFASPRGLSTHICKAHEDCADRTEDRHASNQVGLRLPVTLLRTCKAQAKRRGVTFTEYVRVALVSESKR